MGQLVSLYDAAGNEAKAVPGETGWEEARLAGYTRTLEEVEAASRAPPAPAKPATKDATKDAAQKAEKPAEPVVEKDESKPL